MSFKGQSRSGVIEVQGSERFRGSESSRSQRGLGVRVVKEFKSLGSQIRSGVREAQGSERVKGQSR